MEHSVSQIWPIGGGKGGTGKSFFTGSLGYLLAKQGYKTLLIDVDLGAANLHTIVGVPNPPKSIADFINKTGRHARGNRRLHPPSEPLSHQRGDEQSRHGQPRPRAEDEGLAGNGQTFL